ncbi:MAG: superoxide dismutase family protein [Pseudomonadales bacterium]
MNTLKLSLAATLVLALGACGGERPAPAEMTGDPQHSGGSAPSATQAHVELAPTEGSEVRGSLTFTDEGGALRLHGTITGLEPGSARGFHIHEFGDCSAPDATSAGGHWNPQGHDHGRRSQGEFHAGDMDNITADASGSVTVDDVLTGLEIGTGSARDVVGRSVIVHKGTDDYVSQPTGDAGARAACGVIELQEG